MQAVFPGSPKFTQAKKECSDVSLIIHEESVLTDYSRQCIKRLACLEPNASSELLIPIDDTEIVSSNHPNHSLSDTPPLNLNSLFLGCTRALVLNSI